MVATGADERGVTLVELIVAMGIGVVVLLGVGAFYWETTRAWQQSQTQAAIQRQGTLVQQEMARIVMPASGLLPGTCGPAAGATDSLPVQIPANALPDSGLSGGGYVCFYLTTAGALVECRFTSTTSTTCIANSARDLLVGAPIPEAITGALVAGNSVVFNRVGGAAVDVDFALSAGQVGPLNFGTRLAVRN